MTNPTLLYKQPTPVEKEHHKDWSIEISADFSFCQHSDAAPIAAVEFFLIAKDYPIAFTKTEASLSPIAVLGVRKDQNIFVNKTNNWQKNAYIPALLRGYPFGLLKADKQQRPTLHIDESYKSLNREDKGERLFDDLGNHSEYLKRASGFHQGFQEHMEFTEAFCKALNQLDIMEPIENAFKTPDGKVATINAYFAINKEKFEALSEQKLGALAKAGYLEPIYLHLNSLRNLDTVIRRTRSTRL